jgi:endonuclease YncB( thermonuclease family)
MVKLLINFFIIFIWFQSLNSEEIYGMPKIIDGDTVHIKSKKIRLEGIDAPEIKQQCQKTYLQISAIVGFNFKKNYSCGIISKKKLIDKINKSKINCIASGRDRYKRYLATCYKDKINLNKWMVRNGLAVAYKRYSKEYLRDEAYAKENKLGIWKGSFERPEKWRKLN